MDHQMLVHFETLVQALVIFVTASDSPYSNARQSGDDAVQRQHNWLLTFISPYIASDILRIYGERKVRAVCATPLFYRIYVCVTLVVYALSNCVTWIVDCMHGNAWPVDKTAVLVTNTLTPSTARFLETSGGTSHICWSCISSLRGIRDNTKVDC